MNKKSPWFSIWTKPKATVTSVVTENPKKGLWILAWIYGFLSLLNAFQSLALGHTLSLIPILFLAFFLAPFWGMAVFSIWSFIVHWVGKLFGGKGSFSTVRAAYAWSCVPLTVSILLWGFLLLGFGLSLFQSGVDSHPLQNKEVILLFTVLIGKVILAVWSLVIFINALAAVQHFSVIRSILSILLSWIVIGVFVWIVWWGLSSLSLATISCSEALFSLWQFELVGV